ncbi:MAG: SRPBCC family protein [Proteobacteria bacterium]|nr:SRPBCC family protein [Pseudomonadota bacterium]
MRSTSVQEVFELPIASLWRVLSDPDMADVWGPSARTIRDTSGRGDVGTHWRMIGVVSGEPRLLTQTVVESDRPHQFAVEDSLGCRTTWRLVEDAGKSRVTLSERSPAMEAWPDEMWPVVEAASQVALRGSLGRLARAAKGTR